MTTCIAAITGRSGLNDIHDAIVTASDTRVSFEGLYSAEGTVKLHSFHRDWGALLAGNDMTQYVYVIKRVRRLLRGKVGTLEEVSSAFKKAYQDQFREVIEDDLLSRWGMTIKEFRKKGRQELRPEIYEELALTIKIYKLGCTFLVYGLDDKGIAHLFTVRNPGMVENYDKPGFWAIGQGARAALTMLSALKQVRGRTPFADTVYNVLSAKYFSEKASDVGEETYLWVQRRNTRGFSTKKDLELKIREIWNREGMPKTSAAAIQEIHGGEWMFRSRSKPSQGNGFNPFS